MPAEYPELVYAWRGALLGTYVDEFPDPEKGGVTLFHDHNVGEIRWDEDYRTVNYRIAARAKRGFVPSSQPLTIESEAEIDAVLDSQENEPYGLRMGSHPPRASCRMGADPARSVVNGRGETHDVAGLYVADASLFPISMAVNPQVTVYALANRIADGITGRAMKEVA